MKLPKDLKSFCRKRFLVRVISCVILIALFAGILFLWGKRIINTENTIFRISCYVLIMVVPFVITGVPHKLIDRTYFGTVRKVDIITTADNDIAGKPTVENLYLKNSIYLDIVLTNGKSIYKKAYSGRARHQQNLNAFHKDDFVFHLYGTKNVVVIPHTNDTTVMCAVCGTSNTINNETCRSCGHTLIKYI